jgi:hypothetical protein
MLLRWLKDYFTVLLASLGVAVVVSCGTAIGRCLCDAPLRGCGCPRIDGQIIGVVARNKSPGHW